MKAFCNGRIFIKRFLFPEIEEVNSFLVACMTTRQAMLIDAGNLHQDLFATISKYSFDLKYLFITHNHYDHVSGVKTLMEYFPNITNINRDNNFNLTNHINTSESFDFGLLEGTFHLTPGHTDDMMVLHLAGHIFTGDLLFAGSVGGTIDYQHYAQQKDHIINSILSYPSETIIHPGHGPDSTLALERTYNPFLAI